jgi:predicted  nucleic acid-binding Zn-ribbon protein
MAEDHGNRARFVQTQANAATKKANQLQQQADTHKENAKKATAAAKSQREQAEDKRTQAAEDEVAATALLSDAAYWLNKTEQAAKQAEHYTQQVTDLTRLADNLQAIIDDVDDDYTVFWRASERDA